MTYRKDDELKPVSVATVSKGHVARQSLSVYKWLIKRVGAGVVTPAALPGQRNVSPAANRASKKYKSFSDKVCNLPADSTTYWDFSKDGIDFGYGVGLLNAEVYGVPPAAILNYDPNQEQDVPRAPVEVAEVGADALMADLASEDE